MKKLVCLLLVLIFILSGTALADNASSVQTPANPDEADEDVEESVVLYSVDTEDGLTFNIYNSFAAVSGCKDKMSFSVNIPDTVEGKPVEKIEDGAFDDLGLLASVSFPKGLVSIGDKAFASTNLTHVELPEGLRSIGESAFEECCFSHVVLPSGLERIGNGAFSYCMMLKSVSIPLSVQSIGDDAFAYTGPLEVHYMGTREQWDTLVGDNARCGFTTAVFQFSGTAQSKRDSI